MHHWHLPHEYLFEGRSVRYGITGSGPALVAVHGTPWSSFTLRHLIKALSSHYTVYYYDMVGYGQSDMAPGDVSLGIQNTLLSALLTHWKLEEPIALGHDFGGATVLRTHLLNNVAFSRLILIDPVALSPWGSPFFLHVREHEAAFSGLPAYIHNAIVETYVQTAAHHPLPQETLQGIVAPWCSEAGRHAFYRQITQADSRYTDEVQPLYPSIKVPTQILWGEEDTWIPLAKAHALKALIPAASLHTIPDTGHLVIEEAPERIVEAILT